MFFSQPFVFSHMTHTFLMFTFTEQSSWCHIEKEAFKLLEKPSRWAKPVAKVQLFWASRLVDLFWEGPGALWRFWEVSKDSKKFGTPMD